MAIIALCSELFKITTHMFPVIRKDFLGLEGDVEGYKNAMYLLPKSLPFHLCSILIFFIFFMALSNNDAMIEKIKTFVVPVFILAGGLALIINTSFGSDIKQFESFKQFIPWITLIHLPQIDAKMIINTIKNREK